MNFPENLKYTKDHEWVSVSDTIGVVGITDYAQSELGDIVFVDLQPVGTKVKQGERFGTVEAVKAVSDLKAPLSGEIIELNALLQKTPEIINNEPYDAGWMVKIKIADSKELDVLLDVKHYREFIGK